VRYISYQGATCLTKQEALDYLAWLDAGNVGPAPFAKQADHDHVLHAYSMLRPGGRIVSVMAAGVEYRMTKKSERVRELVDASIDNTMSAPAWHLPRERDRRPHLRRGAQQAETLESRQPVGLCFGLAGAPRLRLGRLGAKSV